MEKPPLVLEIEKLLECKFIQAPVRGDDFLSGVMPYKKDQPKFALQGKKIVGLNLAKLGITDAKWAEIYALDSFKAASLKALNLSDNQLTSFELAPGLKKLALLNLSDNQITRFEPSEGLESLEILNLEDNPLESPPEEILRQGQAATLRFLQNLSTQGTIAVYEVKVLIVGEGETGKTTFWNKLQNIDHPLSPVHESTKGFVIKEGWSFEHIDQAGKQFLVNLWDFGGQEIQYMTHQFFLTRRSLYVLLADSRREAGNFSYWFKIINLLGTDPENNTVLPVVVLLNEKNAPLTKYPYDPETVKLDYPMLELIQYKVNLGEKDYRLLGMQDFIKQILCRRLEHLPLVIPTFWDDVRKALYKIREEKNHINFETFKEICIDNQIEDEEQMCDLSQFLHDLGVVLHFQEEIELKNFIILKPQWAANAVYEVLNHVESLKQQQGRFEKRLLESVWSRKGYTVEEQGYLMNLMMKDNLEVCFETTEKGRKIFIAPQLLPPKNPGFTWKKEDPSLRYIYQYPFMPKGLVGRLIVRLHELLITKKGQKVLWEKGMQLTHEGARALVEEAKDAKTGGKIIQIEVIGEEQKARKDLLDKIRRELDYLHTRSFSRLRFEEKIPCICAACRVEGNDSPHFFDLSILHRREEMGLATIECVLSGQPVAVQGLLEGVFTKEGQLSEKPKRSIPEENAAKLFISYSKANRDAMTRFKTFLNPLIKQGKVVPFDDQQVLPGEEWDHKIRAELEEADIIVLLVSADFLATDYVFDVEIARAMERYESGAAKVVPIILDHCDWEDMPFGKLNGLPTKGRPVVDYDPESKAWTDTIKALKKLL